MLSITNFSASMLARVSHFCIQVEAGQVHYLNQFYFIFAFFYFLQNEIIFKDFSGITVPRIFRSGTNVQTLGITSSILGFRISHLHLPFLIIFHIFVCFQCNYVAYILASLKVCIHLCMFVPEVHFIFI